MLRPGRWLVASGVVALMLFAPIVVNGQMRGRRGSSAAPTHPEAFKGVVNFHGVLKKLAKKEIMIESDDHQVLTFRRNKSTKFFNGDVEIKASEIDMESRVWVDASEDVDLKLIALSINLAPPDSR